VQIIGGRGSFAGDVCGTRRDERLYETAASLVRGASQELFLASISESLYNVELAIRLRFCRIIRLRQLRYADETCRTWRERLRYWLSFSSLARRSRAAARALS
jgi:hypothetical protein